MVRSERLFIAKGFLRQNMELLLNNPGLRYVPLDWRLFIITKGEMGDRLWRWSDLNGCLSRKDFFGKIWSSSLTIPACATCPSIGGYSSLRKGRWETVSGDGPI